MAVPSHNSFSTHRRSGGKILRRDDSIRPAAYVIRNGRTSPLPEKVERKTLSIAGRAVQTMITSNGVGDLYRIYTTTRRDGIDFNLALIGDDFKYPSSKPFDQASERTRRWRRIHRLLRVPLALETFRCSCAPLSP